MPGIFIYTLKVVVCLLMLLTASLAQAKTDLVLLLSRDSKPYQDVVSGMRSALVTSNMQYRLVVITLDELLTDAQLLPVEHVLLITVGSRATRYALDKKISDRIFATFVTRSSLLPELLPNHQLPPQLQGALVLDQPAQRIVALARLLNPRARVLGTAVNGASPSRLDEFVRAVAEPGLQLKVATLFEDSNPISELKAIFSDSDVFVVVPDKARFNSKIAKWVLFLSYRHRVPVIAYSQKYTDAGALVSLFSTPEQIGRDTGERVSDQLAAYGRQLANQRLHTPRYFSLIVNDKVASSLALEIDSAEELKQRLMDKRQFNTADSTDDPDLSLRSR